MADLPESKLDEASVYHDERSHYRGTLHIHTRYSHDTTAPLYELREALIRRKLDYAIIAAITVGANSSHERPGASRSMKGLK